MRKNATARQMSMLNGGFTPLFTSLDLWHVPEPGPKVTKSEVKYAKRNHRNVTEQRLQTAPGQCYEKT
jgi:hypothetical protein